MPIKSYLVFPHPGQRQVLITDLEQMHCDVIPAENNDILVMVSDTDSQEEEDIFIEKLNSLNSLDHYTLVSGFKD